MSSSDFHGTFTALITPFLADESVDFASLEKMIEDQIAAGITGLVMVGTTGESPTLTWDEHQTVVKFAVDTAKGRTKIIAGTGSNATHEAVEHSQIAEKNGVDALLVVSPYYNKPTQQGLFEYFSTVCQSVSIPVIVYNIPGRCGVNVETTTLLRIAQANKNCVGVKEASGNIDQMMEVIRTMPKSFTVLSGEEYLTFPLMALGGHGVISVLSNALPVEVKKMVDTALAGNFVLARDQHFALLSQMKACFIETNPLPIKTLLSAMGKCQEVFRSPLCKMGEGNKKNLLEAFGK
ncbi:MAG: 4-hydroxy-tetrahydrodipicolinate synthase [Candidatus Peregrinibacteria bacterium]